MERHYIRVTLSDGDSFETAINGTKEEIRSYYIGNTFNLGTVRDRMRKAVRVDFLDEETRE